jgi:hypothetical protein
MGFSGSAARPLRVFGAALRFCCDLILNRALLPSRERILSARGRHQPAVDDLTVELGVALHADCDRVANLEFFRQQPRAQYPNIKD